MTSQQPERGLSDQVPRPIRRGQGRFLILGGGFAGLEVAINLRRELHDAQVTLVSPSDDLSYKPWWTYLLSGDRGEADCIVPLQPIAERHGFELRIGRARRLWANPFVAELDDGSDLAAEAVLMATGASADRDRVPGAERHALFASELADLKRLQQTITAQDVTRVAVVAGWEYPEAAVEHAGWIGSPGCSDRIGPGVRLTLIDAESCLKRVFGEAAEDRIKRHFASRGHRVVFGHRVVAFTDHGVELEGARVEVDAVLMATPLCGPDFGVPQESQDPNGFLEVNDYGETVHAGLFAFGDVAAHHPQYGVPRSLRWIRGRAGEVAANMIDRVQGRRPRWRLTDRIPRLRVLDLGGSGMAVRSGRVLISGKLPLLLRARSDRSYLSALRLLDSGGQMPKRRVRGQIAGDRQL